MRNFILTSLVFLLLVGCVSQPGAKHQRRESDRACTFNQGFHEALERRVYDNTCSFETEENFLIGYAIGRKVRWVEAEVDEEQHHVQCLKKEYDLKFSKTLSPIHIDSHLENSEIYKTLKANNCPSDTFRSMMGLNSELKAAKNNLAMLLKKKQRLYDLVTQIEKNPESITETVNIYKNQNNLDSLDIDLRWRERIASKGGVDKLNFEEKSLVVRELFEQPSLSQEVIMGAYVYGFGIGHYRQGRYAQVGWIYTVIDSFFTSAVLYGAFTKQPDIWGPALVFGLPLSHMAQYVGVYNYNIEANADWNNLRTQTPASPLIFNYAWAW